MELPEWLNKEAWEAYWTMRKRKKWVFSERSQRRMLNKLEKAMRDGYDTEFMLDEAENGNWKDVYITKNTPRDVQTVEPISDHLFEVYKRDLARTKGRPV